MSTSTEEAKRLKPTGATIRQLFARSGNLCAFPECTHLLIDAEGEFIAQVAHIEVAEDGGERFNKDMSNEQRRHPDNLVLLCYEHHVKTNDVTVWTVSKMKKMKEDHERRFRNPEKSILAGLKDWTQSDELILPQNLDALHQALESPFLDEDHAEDKERYFAEVTKYLGEYKNVPLETRSFLGALVERMLTVEKNGLTHYGMHQTSMPVDDLKGALMLSQSALRKSIEALERYRLGELDEGSTALKSLSTTSTTRPSGLSWPSTARRWGTPSERTTWTSVAWKPDLGRVAWRGRKAPMLCHAAPQPQAARLFEL